MIEPQKILSYFILTNYIRTYVVLGYVWVLSFLIVKDTSSYSHWIWTSAPQYILYGFILKTTYGVVADNSVLTNLITKMSSGWKGISKEKDSMNIPYLFFKKMKKYFCWKRLPLTLNVNFLISIFCVENYIFVPLSTDPMQKPVVTRPVVTGQPLLKSR